MVVVVPAASRYPAEPPLVGFLCSALLPKTCLEVTKRLLGEAALRVRTNLEEYEAPVSSQQHGKLSQLICMHVESLPGCASFNCLCREFRPLKLSPHDAMASPRGRLRCSGSSALG